MIGQFDGPYVEPAIDGPDPEVLRTAVNGQRWSGLMPDIEAEIERAKAQVATRVYGMINEGTLTPEASHLAWMEVHALDKMLKRFNSKVKLGLNMSQQLAKHINQGETDNG